MLLPNYTLSNELITTPGVIGKDRYSAIVELQASKLNYHVNSSLSYNKNYRVGDIVDQNPINNTVIKPFRTVFITENIAGKVKMPNLVYQTLRNAYVLLRSKDLNLGKIKYIIDIADNVVLEQHINEEKVFASSAIFLPQKIDLVVGINSLTKKIKIPNIVGKNLDDAHMSLIDNYLNLREVSYVTNHNYPTGIVMHQSLAEGSIRSIGTCIDVIVSK